MIRSSQARRKEEIAGFLFILPTYFFYLVFMLIPMGATIFFSFTKYNVIKPAQWIGLANYAKMFKDMSLPTITSNTIIYTVLTTLFKTLLALILAIGLNSRKIISSVRNITRASIFFPYIIAMSYVSLIWGFMFSKDMGIVNYYLNRLGIASVPWFTDFKLALYMLIILDVWKNSGYGMLIFLSGLQGISSDFYEAAQIDGASRWQQIRYITLPLLRPVTVMMIILNTINGFQCFDSMSVVTNGGPGNATRSIVLYLYEKGFKSYDMGYASALSIVLIIIMLVISLFQLRLDKTNSKE